jgi:6-pyruvoyltetrahydropterin/6-carboxytetrahydropterin synthase
MFTESNSTSAKNRRITVKRISHFNAAHRLNVDEWSAKENEDFFGLCNNKFFHGHNYKIEVLVKGEIDKVSGYLMDLKVLQKIIDQEIVLPWDHKNLNLQVEDFKHLNPTAENMAIVAYNKIKKRIDSKFELKIILHETERNSVEYEGE